MRLRVIAGLGALVLALAGTGVVSPLVAQEIAREVMPAAASTTEAIGAMAPAPGPAPAAKKTPECRPGFGCVTNLPLPRFVSLKGDEGNARRGPGLTHRIDWVFTRPGMPLMITAEYEHWRRVEDQDGAGGWVHYALLSGVRMVLVTTDMAEFHASPDRASEVIAQAEYGVIGKVLECNPGWCRIASGGEKGWIEKSALWGVGADEAIE
jgi:SH3-like domain-containing protein